MSFFYSNGGESPWVLTISLLFYKINHSWCFLKFFEGYEAKISAILVIIGCFWGFLQIAMRCLWGCFACSLHSWKFAKLIKSYKPQNPQRRFIGICDNPQRQLIKQNSRNPALKPFKKLKNTRSDWFPKIINKGL